MKQILLLALTISLLSNLTAQENNWEVYLRGQAVRAIEFENDNVWVATDSFLVKLNKLDKSTTYYPYPDIIEDMMIILKIDKKGVKWIARSGKPWLDPVNSICGFDGNKWDKIAFYGNGPIYSVAVDKNNNTWFTANGFHSHLYKLEQGVCVQYSTENTGLLYDYVFKVVSDKNGDIWLENYGNMGDPAVADVSLVKYDGKKWTSYLSEYGLFYTAVSFDNQVNPWIQQLSLLRKLDTASNSWSEQINLDIDYSCQLQAIEGEEKFWFKGNDNGVAFYKDSDWSFYTTSNSELPSDTVYQIAIDSKSAKWIGTAKGLAAFNENGLNTSVSPDSKMMNKIVLFPNPAHDFIILKIPREIQNSKVEILNIQGRVMKSFSLFNDQNRLDVSQLPSGIYLFKIQADENHILKKIVKQ